MLASTARLYRKPGIFKRPRFTDWITCVVGLAVASTGMVLMYLLPEAPYIALVPFVALACISLLWRVEQLPIFVLLGMATVVEIYPLGFSDATTEQLGLWNNLSTLGLKGVPVSPAELLMVGGMLAWLLRGLFSQTLEFRGSTMIQPYLWYLVMVAFGLVHGMSTGGVLTIAFWEIRSQVYGVIVFFLLLNTLHSRRHLEIASWIMILGTGFKGIQGSFRYMVTLGGSFGGDAILEHDEGFFFPAFYIFTLLLFVFRGTPAQKRTALGLLPFVVLADMANKRRASTASLVIAGIALVFILYVVLKQRRFRIVGIAAGVLTLVLTYGAAFWNSDSRFAQPVRAIKSAISPDARDESSNLYREQEDYNLMSAIQANPIIGRGFGHPMDNVAGMFNLDQIDPFIMYRPHNSILWVWWRTGILGIVLFWMAIGLVIIRHCFIAKAATDPYLRRWAIFSVCVMIMFMTQSWWDMGQFRYRIVVYSWIVLAIVEVQWRQYRQTLNAPQLKGAFS
jgi:hypothetical protein